MPELRIEANPVDVTPISEPDPDWSYTDRRGHTHRWSIKEGGGTLPTLRRVIDAPATEEYPESAHYECGRCGEPVEPRERAPRFATYSDMFKRYYIDDREVSEEEYERALRELG